MPTLAFSVTVIRCCSEFSIISHRALLIMIAINAAEL